ncbi:hypothetical protein LWI28_008645 [Acer negundo]|uniref:Uncharacterized protein n=1 Tax=Acer negundo TaxID=4023 RepID=A0AAD5IZ69_ACENE|nr:hypothetical protein LWI28_008645 [Acer negundo]
MFSLWRSVKFLDPTFTEIGHCYRLYSHKSGGDGWWVFSCCDKRDVEPLIIDLPSSNKEWKKTWFVARGNWGKDLQLCGRPQRVRSVFNIIGVWGFLRFYRKLTETAKDRMTDKGKSGADKRKENEKDKKKRVIPTGSSLLSKDEATEQVSPLKRARADKSSVSIAFKEGLPQAIRNILHMEKMYEEVNGRYEKLQKEKYTMDEKLRRSLATVGSQRATISEASTSYRRVKSLALEK